MAAKPPAKSRSVISDLSTGYEKIKEIKLPQQCHGDCVLAITYFMAITDQIFNASLRVAEDYSTNFPVYKQLDAEVDLYLTMHLQDYGRASFPTEEQRWKFYRAVFNASGGADSQDNVFKQYTDSIFDEIEKLNNAPNNQVGAIKASIINQANSFIVNCIDTIANTAAVHRMDNLTRSFLRSIRLLDEAGVAVRYGETPFQNQWPYEEDADATKLINKILGSSVNISKRRRAAEYGASALSYLCDNAPIDQQNVDDLINRLTLWQGACDDDPMMGM